MGLNIGMFRTKQFLNPLSSQLFHHVNMFTATIIATTRIPLSIFIG